MSVRQWLDLCRADWQANAGYPKSRIVLLLFRTAQSWRGASSPAAPVAYPALAVLYKVVSEWLLGIELPPSTSVGPGLRLRHGVGLVVNPASVIGANVMLRHGVTIGNRRSELDCPVIEDGVEFGAGAVAIGAITIGARSRIGAGAVVTTDLPPNSVAYHVGTAIRRAGGRGE